MTEASAEEHGRSLDRLCTELNRRRHMVVATNRGPVSLRPTRGSEVSASLSGGATVSALAPLAERVPLTWVSLASNEAELRAGRASPEGVSMGAPLPETWGVRFAEASRRVSHRHYNLICNPLLWFLHHRIWGPSHTPNIDETIVDAWENGHVPVTLSYLVEIEAEAKRVDKPLFVNTRDFTLPLLPGLVRSSLPDALIVHSADVPWPGPDWWLLLPNTWRESAFRSLLACDVITFPTARDRRAFAACAAEFVNDVSVGTECLSIGDHSVDLAIAPAGLNVAGLEEFSDSQRVASEVRRLASTDDLHTFATVERAEPHKNILRSLRAFRSLLEQNQELIGKVRCVLVLAPPPPHVSQYRRYVDEIKAEVKDLDRKFRRGSWQPVELHLERNYAKATAALRIYDTLISVPLADGGLGSATDGPVVNRRDGTLIVSETSPAADLYGNLVLPIAPADIAGMAKAMREAIELTTDERARIADNLRDRATGWTPEAALENEFEAVVDRL